MSVTVREPEMSITSTVIDHAETRFIEAADVAATSDHGGAFTAAVAKDNIVGVQYHPEKSQAYGLATLQRFLTWRP